MKKNYQISDSELEIMRILWDKNNSCLFADIMEALNSKNLDWKSNTVLTFLVRLVDKGVVSTVKHGRINEYVALISLQDYLTEQTKTFVSKVYGGNAKNLVSSLLKNDYITSTDIQELENYWKEGTNKSE